MTLERLILSTLAEGKTVTAKQVSKLWGEDEVRVDGWLRTFVKRGLCTSGERVVKGRVGSASVIHYSPNLPAIREAASVMNAA